MLSAAAGPAIASPPLNNTPVAARVANVFLIAPMSLLEENLRAK
ncbi:hypothetical protein ACFQBR_06890 [Nocardiopsis tropica]